MNKKNEATFCQEAATDIMEKKGFRPVPGWPGYFVNRTGVVLVFQLQKLNIKTKTWRHYPRFSAWNSKNGRNTSLPVHRAVALAFLGPNPPGKEVAHLDGNRHNYNLENLKYVTRKENHAHMLLHGTAQRGEKHGCAKLTNAQAAEIKKTYWSNGKNKGNAGELSRRFGVCKSTIIGIGTGKKWKHL